MTRKSNSIIALMLTVILITTLFVTPTYATNSNGFDLNVGVQFIDDDKEHDATDYQVNTLQIRNADTGKYLIATYDLSQSVYVFSGYTRYAQNFTFGLNKTPNVIIKNIPDGNYIIEHENVTPGYAKTPDIPMTIKDSEVIIHDMKIETENNVIEFDLALMVGESPDTDLSSAGIIAIIIMVILLIAVRIYMEVKHPDTIRQK